MAISEIRFETLQPVAANKALATAISEDAALRDRESVAVFEHADPVTEAEILVERGRLLVDFIWVYRHVE